VPADEYAECLLKARFLTDDAPVASADDASHAGDGRAGATPGAAAVDGTEARCDG
jgi:hypothetical protein